MAKGEDITTKFKVDISDLKKGISEANKQIKLANAEFKAASAGMDDWSKSSAGISAKLKQLGSVLAAQNSKLKSYKDQLKAIEETEQKNGKRADELKTKLQQLASQGVSKTSAEYKKYEKALTEVEKEQLANKTAADNLKVTILNQQAAVNKTEKEMNAYSSSLKDVEKAEKLAATSGKSVEDELKNIAQEADKTESKVGKLAKGLAKGLATAAVAGATAAAAGLVAITKSAITNFAEYEQLVGGVDTLFKGSSKKVQEYAANAYKTAGVSANQYMETVTSFSASLLQSLGGDTAKAADVADMALTDMADNANKMGTAMSSIQDAYQGFAKQNYTMLDNLKLGYGGTKTEMERLLADAQKISGVKYDITNLNDVYQAIHVIQGELGITGTTAKEAATTIQGSATAMKSAWGNLMTGLADDNANMEVLISNFIDSIGTFASNLIPRIQEVLSTIVQLVIDHLPEISAQIIKWMGSLVDNMIAALPPGLQEIASAIKDGLVNAFKGLVDIVKDVIDKFSQMSKWLSEHKTAAGILAGVIGTLTAAIIAYNIQQAIMNAGGVKAIASMVAQKVATIALTGVTTIATAATTAFGAAMAFLTSPVTLVIAAIAALVAGIVLLVKNWDTVKEAGAKCWEAIKNAWNSAGEWFNATIIEPIKNFFSDLWSGIKDGASKAWDGVKNIFSGVKNFFKNAFQSAWTSVKNVFSNWGSFFSGLWNKVTGVFKKVGTTVSDAISGSVRKAVNGVLSGAAKVINGFISAINLAIDVINAIPGVSISKLSKLNVPQLERGIGLAKKGHQYLLEGKGNEAVVPLDKNKYWIKAVADDMRKELQGGVASTTSNLATNNVNNFTQVINAPKSPSRIELYRDAKNLLNYTKVRA